MKATTNSLRALPAEILSGSKACHSSIALQGQLVRSVSIQKLQGQEFTPQRLRLTRHLTKRLNHGHGAEGFLDKYFEGDELAIQFAVAAASESAAY